MKLENGKLVMGKKDCHWCDHGTRPGEKACTVCRGTGLGKRGKARGCKECYGSGKTPDFDNRVTCNLCDGNWQNSQEETLYDYLPENIWQGMKFEVVRAKQSLSFNERYIGAGCVLSCEDYGSAWNKSDAEVIAEVRANTSHQACKMFRKDGTPCDHIAICVMPGGWAARAVYAETPSLVS